MTRSSRPLLAVAMVVAVAVGQSGAVPSAVAARPVTSPAPGAPGAMSHFGLARKDCVGTARNTTSKVWFTVAGGVLSDVYFPTIDTTNIETLQYIVTDGSTFTDLQTRDTTYTVESLDDSGMSCRVTSVAKNGKYTLVTDYVTDPRRNSVAMETTLRPARGVRNLSIYVRMDATVNGNGGGGDPVGQNAGADDAVIDTSTGSPVPVSIDTQTSTIAANRDYATPVYVALRADRPFLSRLQRVRGYGERRPRPTRHRPAPERRRTRPPPTATWSRSPRSTPGPTAPSPSPWGSAPTSAEPSARLVAPPRRGSGTCASATPMAGRTTSTSLEGPGNPPGLDGRERAEIRRTYRTSAAVLKASEDKTFPGAIVASLASPWGQAVAAGDPALTYFGSYREVFARDLYETFTGLLAAGDTETAEDTVRFLFERQQLADGSFPRNSLINGKLAPDSFGIQLDEVAYPILMARTVGLTDADFYADEIRPAADFLVARGPAFGAERWEEQSGWSPSTIAAEIAGLTAAGAIAELNGDMVRARIYRATADHYQRSVKGWTVTSNGPLEHRPVLHPPVQERRPELGVHLQPRQRRARCRSAGDHRRRVPGAAAAGDPSRRRPRRRQLRRRRRCRHRRGPPPVATGSTATAPAPPEPRTATATATSADATDCTVQGKPWAGVCGTQAQNRGSGHLWPVLSAERGEHQVADGDRSSAAELLLGMSRDRFRRRPDS